MDYIAESARSATRWTDSQKAEVDTAIVIVASKKTDFTANDIWDELGDSFPVNCGLPSRLVQASKRGIIYNTGTTRFVNRGKRGHQQHLTVWALVP